MSELAVRSQMSAAAAELASIGDGAVLTVRAVAGGIEISAPGMRTITAALPVGTGIVIGPDRSGYLQDTAELIMLAERDNDPIGADAWFWLTSCLLSAGHDGIRVQEP